MHLIGVRSDVSICSGRLRNGAVTSIAPVRRRRCGLNRVNPVRWLIVLLHALMLTFSALILFVLQPWLVPTDQRVVEGYPQAVYFGLTLIAANAGALILLSTSLTRSFLGVAILIGYETLFLAATLVWFSWDYSVIVAVIIAALSYMGMLHRRSHA
ncbi:MAG: hypothetical protein JWQ07_5861 [Ramlibacter sp.]|nr:hypothetical protein [Ramlibacter sp.]